MQNYSSVNGQSILDICLSVYGTLDCLYKLIVDNNISGVDYVPITGQLFSYDDSITVNSNAFQKRNPARYSTLYQSNSITDFNVDFNIDF